MAQALVTITAELILNKVVSIAADEIAVTLGYRKRLETFEQRLRLIRAKLRDTEKDQAQTDAVSEWVKQLKDVVGKADDVLDNIHYDMLRKQVKNRDQNRKKVQICFPSLKKLSFRREIGHNIDKINNEFSEIIQEATNLGLQDQQQPGRVPDTLYRETDSYTEEFKMVGRKDEELHIIHLLVQSSSQEKLRIVPIVGMGGIGKTTLAKSIYNNEQLIKPYFDVKAWLCVSVKVGINTLLGNIYESVEGKRSESETKDILIKKLREKLESKRYLLVLDDVWDEERSYWDDFRSCMLKVNGKDGSGILVTSRKLEIGTNDMTKDSCSLQGLSQDECLSIFKQRAFEAGQPPLPDLEKIGDEIVKKCRGLPLLVNVIGGMLHNYTDREKWLSIRDSKVWDLEDDDRVQKTLKLSFDNLPNSIAKQCFVYCSIFKKDAFMEREDLIQLWMALGLVQEDKMRNKEMEDVGYDVFQILVRNSLFQDVKPNIVGVVGSTMHDLVHDLSLSLSEHERSCLENSHDFSHIPHVKHLAMCDCELSGVPISNFSENMIVARSLHTLFIEGSVLQKFPFQHFKCLRILKFKVGLEKLDVSIGELVHLRYLDLINYRLSDKLNDLPKSIGKLYHLQTLKLPNSVEHFPEEMRNLVSLRHIKFAGIIPSHIVGQLTSLRSLSCFKVGRKKGCEIEVLGRLKHLCGSLHIRNLEEVSSKEDAIKADLSAKKLWEIGFKWSRNEGANRNDKDVLEGLQPSENLKILEIKNFSGDNFPSWVTKMAIDIKGKWTPLHNLTELSLYGCSDCLSLPMLEHLPLLRDLELDGLHNLTCLRSCGGDNVTGSLKPLSPSLRSIRLIDMKRLEKWIDGATMSSAMLSPVLESLYIERCPEIVVLDECHPHPLVSLMISCCENIVSIKSIQGLTSLQSLTIINGPTIKSIQALTSLQSLTIRDCPSLSEVPFVQNQQLYSLKTLRIEDCHKVTSLPPNMFDCFAFLNKLSLGPFSKELPCFPNLQGIEKLRNHLHLLELYGWPHWESIPEEIKHLTSLTSLTIWEFGMRELPEWLTNMSSIQDMYFTNCKGPDVHNQQLHSLKRLTIIKCHKVTSLPPKMFDCFAFLNELRLGLFSKELPCFPSLQGIEKLRNHLHLLELYGWPHWESIPEEIKHLTSLTQLTIEGFGIRELPEWLTNMSSIRDMDFNDCNGLDEQTIRRGAPREATDVRLNYSRVK